MNLLSQVERLRSVINEIDPMIQKQYQKVLDNVCREFACPSDSSLYKLTLDPEKNIHLKIDAFTDKSRDVLDHFNRYFVKWKTSGGGLEKVLLYPVAKELGLFQGTSF